MERFGASIASDKNAFVRCFAIFAGDDVARFICVYDIFKRLGGGDATNSDKETSDF